MRTITLEEHFATPGFLDGPGLKLKEQALKFGRGKVHNLLEQICDLSDKRVAEMDAAHIDMQILSLTSPGAEQLEAAEAAAFARETNRVPRRCAEEPSDSFWGICHLAHGRPFGRRRRTLGNERLVITVSKEPSLTAMSGAVT